MMKRMVALALLFAWPAHAKDHGRWDSYHLTEQQRAWFKSVTNGDGSECCDDSDGYPVEYEMRPDNPYWVHFQGRWIPVPDRKPVSPFPGRVLHIVRRHIGNPTGQGGAWFYEFEGIPILTASCRRMSCKPLGSANASP
jgi:hypothetical protein